MPSVNRSAGPAAQTARAMAYMVASGIAGTAMGAVIRHVSQELHPFEIAFFRNVFGLLLLLPLVWRHGLASLRTRRPGLHFTRGILNVGVVMFLFTAVSMAPLEKVTALSFTAPLFATVLAVLVLGERVRARRVIALATGFAGMLVILRPGLVAIDLGTSLALAGATTWATSMIVVKMLARTESSVTITVRMAIVGIPFTLLAALMVWRTPSMEALFWCGVLGALGGTAHLTVAQAFKLGEASAVLPVDFLRLIWAAALGYALFGERPDFWTWVGGAVIFTAATYIALRERNLARRRAGADAAADR